MCLTKYNKEKTKKVRDTITICSDHGEEVRKHWKTKSLHTTLYLIIIQPVLLGTDKLPEESNRFLVYRMDYGSSLAMNHSFT